MAREPVQFEGGYEPLRPVASPVDTFVQPGPSPLREVAESLRSITPGLDAFFAADAKKRREEDTIRGRAAYYGQNREALAEAVRTGRIPSQYSPAFVQGFKESHGKFLGNQMVLDFNAAWEGWAGKGSATEADFTKWLGDYVGQNLTSDDPEVLKSLQPRVEALQDFATNKWIEYRNATTQKGALETSVAVANQAVDIESASGITTEKGTDYPRLFTTILKQREDYVSAGGNAQEWDKAWVDSMATKIIETRDPQLLKFFEQTVPGTDYKYGDTAYGAKVKQDTIEALEVVHRRAVADESAAQVKADKEREDRAESAIIQHLITDPAGPVPEALIKDLEGVNGRARVLTEEWRRSLGSGFTDPAKAKMVYREIMEGGGVKAVTKALDSGVFGTAEDLSKAMSFAKSIEDNKDRIGEALGSATAKAALETFKVRTASTKDLERPNPGWSDDGLKARDDFTSMVIEWTLKNPDASLMDQERALVDMRELILKRFEVQPAMQGEEGGQTYTRPFGGTPLTAPEKGASPTPTPPSTPAPTTSPAQTVAPIAPKPGRVTLTTPAEDGIKTWLSGLNEQQLAAVKEAAFARGLTLESYVGQVILADPRTAATPDPVAQQEAAKKAAEPKPWLEIPSLGIKIGPWQGPGASQGDKPGEQQGSLTGPDPLPIEMASYVPGSGGRAFAPKGMEALAPNGLVTSTKRGYQPDIANLQPAVRQGIEQLQASFGADLPIVSGYRDPARNAKAGGAKHSQHMHGNAVDIDVSGMSTKERVRLIQMASSQGFTGIGVYANSVHLDYGGRRAWGPSHSSDSVPRWASAAISSHLSGRSRMPPGASPKLPGITPEMATAFLDEALSVQPYDTGYEGSSKMVGADGSPDEDATRLANLIYQAESGGNYNALSGNAGSTFDLSKLTLDAVLTRQLAARQAGAPSTAVGAGQFVYKTLASLKSELGLSGSERFTPELQDRLFMALLNRRGYQEYKAGKLSKRAFARNLSQEWAALPDPSTGQSYYAGVGNNRHQVSRGQVYAALGL